MAIVWVLEPKQTSFDDSLAIRLLGEFSVRVFSDTHTFTLAWEQAFAIQSNPQIVCVHSSHSEFKASESLNTILDSKARQTKVLNFGECGMSVEELNRLCNRIRELATHIEVSVGADAGSESFEISLGDLVLDLKHFSCHFKSLGETTHLPRKEALILGFLLKNLELCISRDQICQEVWDGVKVSPRTIDSHISRLRTRLSEYSELRIESVYGGGYILR